MPPKKVVAKKKVAPKKKAAPKKKTSAKASAGKKKAVAKKKVSVQRKSSAKKSAKKSSAKKSAASAKKKPGTKKAATKRASKKKQEEEESSSSSSSSSSEEEEDEENGDDVSSGADDDDNSSNGELAPSQRQDTASPLEADQQQQQQEDGEQEDGGGLSTTATSMHNSAARASGVGALHRGDNSSSSDNDVEGNALDDADNNNGGNNNKNTSPRIRQRNDADNDFEKEEVARNADDGFRSPPHVSQLPGFLQQQQQQRAGSTASSTGPVPVPPTGGSSQLHHPQQPVHFKRPPTLSASPSLRPSPAGSCSLGGGGLVSSMISTGGSNAAAAKSGSVSRDASVHSKASSVSTAFDYGMSTPSNAPSMAVSNFSVASSVGSTAGGIVLPAQAFGAGGGGFGSNSSSVARPLHATPGGGASNYSSEHTGLVSNAVFRAASPSAGDHHHHHRSAAATHLSVTPLGLANTASPPLAVVGGGLGADVVFPAQPNTHNSNAAQQHQLQLLRGASPARGMSRSHTGGNNSNNNKSESPARAPLQQQQPQEKQQHTPSFADLVAEEIARVLAITTTTSNASSEAAPTTMMDHDALLAIGRSIADALIAHGGRDYAARHYVDLCSSLEMPGHEAIRERIRTGALTPAAVAALRPEELLSQSERTELAKRIEQDNRDHDIGEITRQVASVTKVDECPSCKHMEAAVLEQGNQGGAPRFWGGGEEEQQVMTLLQCLNCRHEWVREAKY